MDLRTTGRPVLGADGAVIAALASLREVSEQKRLQDELRALSISAELTGLYNRRGFLILAENTRALRSGSGSRSRSRSCPWIGMD